MSAVRKRSVGIRGHRTSFSLEDEFFAELEALARSREIPLSVLIGEIDAARPRDTNLSSALRLHVLRMLRDARHE